MSCQTLLTFVIFLYIIYYNFIVFNKVGKMSYSLGLITRSESEASMVLLYLESHLKVISEMHGVFIPIVFKKGSDLSYIKDNRVVGIDFSIITNTQMSYIITVLYAVAKKFNIHHKINGKKFFLLDNDGMDRWILSKSLPANQQYEDYGFILINDNDVKEIYSGHWLHRIIYSAKKYESKLKEISKAIQNKSIA
jgi:hypothetical protein